MPPITPYSRRAVMVYHTRSRCVSRLELNSCALLLCVLDPFHHPFIVQLTGRHGTSIDDYVYWEQMIISNLDTATLLCLSR